MELKERAAYIVQTLETEYPDAVCSLESQNALQLLIATRLSAQCTDARVNVVTKDLFARYRTVEDFAGAEVADVEAIIHSCGLFHTKARDIVRMCQALLADHSGQVPDTLEALIKLPGVGRKTANLIMGDIYGQPAIVADTHCIRISNRLGLVSSKDPKQVELRLRDLIAPEKSSMFCHRLVWHGRAVCKARGPECAHCCLAPYCASVNHAVDSVEAG
ncbi:MAG: endonuclease III [Ethanoligenens sp.]|uniref:endonuclease III n=1 Tax=Ethanoligenens sp. TaxID=2099655 RepID=UPI0039ECCE03